VNEIAVILSIYSIDKGRPGRLIQSSPTEAKNGRLVPFLRDGLSDYAVTEISQYVWWGSLQRYGQKVHKLTLHGVLAARIAMAPSGVVAARSVTWPPLPTKPSSITPLPSSFHIRQAVNRAKQYLAYFQAYTSTWAEVQVLRSMYQQAVSQASIVGLCVGTRPDCVPEAVLDLLCEYKDQGYEIWLELGLQTANDKTLHRINRGHDFACYQKTTRLARERGLKVCSHLIVGLPGKGNSTGWRRWKRWLRRAWTASSCIRCIS
jgi:radical SAM protein (TIGR01212 family)